MENYIRYGDGMVVRGRRLGMIQNLPVVGSAYGLVKTSIRVYNASSPVDAVSEALVGVVVDCMPPVVKYPVLCSYLLLSGVATVVTGCNPLAISSLI